MLIPRHGRHYGQRQGDNQPAEHGREARFARADIQGLPDGDDIPAVSTQIATPKRMIPPRTGMMPSTWSTPCSYPHLKPPVNKGDFS
jgi:hypothetical protein